MDGSVYKKKLSQLHSKSLLQDRDEISLWELLGFLEKKECFLFPLVSFSFFRCSSELLPVLQPETAFSMHFVLVKLISQEHIEERMNWFYFCKMNNAETLEWNHWKSALLWSLRCFGAPAFFSHVDHWVGVGQGQDEQLTSTLRRSHCQTRQKR